MHLHASCSDIKRGEWKCDNMEVQMAFVIIFIDLQHLWNVSMWNWHTGKASGLDGDSRYSSLREWVTNLQTHILSRLPLDRHSVIQYCTSALMKIKVDGVTDRAVLSGSGLLLPHGGMPCLECAPATGYCTSVWWLYRMVCGCKSACAGMWVSLFVSLVGGRGGVEASVFTWLAECLLFNLSSVKLTYLPPLTTDVWLAQPAP